VLDPMNQRSRLHPRAEQVSTSSHRTSSTATHMPYDDCILLRLWYRMYDPSLPHVLTIPFLHSLYPPISSLLLTRRLLRMLRKRMLRVRAQPALGVIAVLLGALLDAAALVVDVARRLAGLGVGLLLWLGGLAAGVGGGHDVCVWVGLVGSRWVLGLGLGCGCGGSGGGG